MNTRASESSGSVIRARRLVIDRRHQGRGFFRLMVLLFTKPAIFKGMSFPRLREPQKRLLRKIQGNYFCGKDIDFDAAIIKEL